MAADTQGMDVDGGAGGKLVEPSLCCDANDTRKSQNQSALVKRSGSERGLAPHSEWSLKNKTPLSSFLNASRISVCDVPPFDFCNFTLSENSSTKLVATARQSQQNHPTNLCTLSSLAEEWCLGIQGTEPVAGDLQPGTSHTWPGAQDVSCRNAGVLTGDAPRCPCISRKARHVSCTRQSLQVWTPRIW